jgi:hypothetical protein
MPRFSIFVLLFLSTAVTACENRKAEAASASATASAAVVASSASTIEAATKKDVAAKVARVVFVGKEHACDCTRKKVDTALAALHTVLGTPPKIPVEMLKADTEEEKVEPYRKLRPMMALPAIYFIDAKGGLVEMLQGEITEAQVSGVLAR